MEVVSTQRGGCEVPRAGRNLGIRVLQSQPSVWAKWGALDYCPQGPLCALRLLPQRQHSPRMAEGKCGESESKPGCPPALRYLVTGALSWMAHPVPMLGGRGW